MIAFVFVTITNVLTGCFVISCQSAERDTAVQSTAKLDADYALAPSTLGEMFMTKA